MSVLSNPCFARPVSGNREPGPAELRGFVKTQLGKAWRSPGSKGWLME